MEVAEIKRRGVELGESITQAIIKFEKETETYIESIDLNRDNYIGSGTDYGILESVHLEVKI